MRCPSRGPYVRVDVDVAEFPARVAVGFIAACKSVRRTLSRPGYWGKEGPELMAWLEEKLAEEHTLVMGANTYRTMSQIVADGDDPTFERMSEIRKVVFSSTLRSPLTWANTEVAQDAVATLRAMKAEGSASIRTMGSISLNETLLREGLVDLLQIVVFPVVTGVSGRNPIFAGWPDLDLELVSTRTFDGRMHACEVLAGQRCGCGSSIPAGASWSSDAGSQASGEVPGRVFRNGEPAAHLAMKICTDDRRHLRLEGTCQLAGIDEVPNPEPPPHPQLTDAPPTAGMRSADASGSHARDVKSGGSGSARSEARERHAQREWQDRSDAGR